MKATGIIRRVDDLGRVVIPRDIRRNCRIYEGDPLEIYVDNLEGQPVVILSKYEPNFSSSLARLANSIDDEMEYTSTAGQRREVQEHFNEIAKILKEWEKRG